MSRAWTRGLPPQSQRITCSSIATTYWQGVSDHTIIACQLQNAKAIALLCAKRQQAPIPVFF